LKLNAFWDVTASSMAEI